MTRTRLASTRGFPRPAVPALAATLLGLASLSSANAAEPPQAPTSLDGLFVEVARQAPAFGGAYFADGGLIVHVIPDGKTVSDKACARAVDALEAVLGRYRRLQPLGDPRHVGAREGWAERKPVCKPGQFSFAELADWRQRARKAFSIRGVVSTDIDESRNVIVIKVSDVKRVAPDVYRLLDSAGIPGAAVAVEQETERLRYLQDGSIAATEHRPVFGGVEIGDSDLGNVCTLAVNVRVPGLFSWLFGDARGFLTNSHCADNMGAAESSEYDQPSGGDRIALEWIDPPFWSDDCEVQKCRWSDSAIAIYDDNVADNFARIARTIYPDGSVTLDPDHSNFEITGEQWIIMLDDIVQKTGARGGWGAGYVVATCVDLGPTDNQGNIGDTMFKCQHIVQAPLGYDGARPGDSGSPVYIWTGQEWVTLVGLLWAGFVDTSTPDMAQRYVFSPIPNVRSDLGNFYTFD